MGARSWERPVWVERGIDTCRRCFVRQKGQQGKGKPTLRQMKRYGGKSLQFHMGDSGGICTERIMLPFFLISHVRRACTVLSSSN